MKNRWSYAALVVGLAAVPSSISSCAGRAGDPSSEPPSPSPRAGDRALSAPIALGDVMDRAHFAFREDGQAFVVRDRSYDASATASSFAVTPRGATGGASVVAARFTTLAPAGLDLARTRTGADGSLYVDRPGGPTERLRGDAEGIEQSWSFPTRPEGGADIELRVRVDGETYAGATDGGLHFVDRATGAGVRYGNGVWVDARGTRTDVRARFEGGAIVLRVPADVVRASAFPAVLDPRVSPELGMDAPIGGTASAGAVIVDAAASDGTNVLVVWRDDRASIDTSRKYVYAARVDASGKVLDPTGIAVGPVSYPSNVLASVAFDGTGFMIVWEGLRARVDASGKVQDPGGVPLWSPVVAGVRAGPIAFDGTSFLVACNGCGKLTRLATNGTVIATIPWAGPAAADDAMASLACDGASCLVASGRASTVEAVRVSNANVVLDATPIPVASQATGTYGSTATTFGGSGYFVAWADPAGALAGRRITTAGALGGAVVPIAPVAGAKASSVRAVFDGTSYQIAWNADGAAPSHLVARVTTAGTVLDSPPVKVGDALGFFNGTALACRSGSCLTAWIDPSRTLRAARVATSNEAVLDTPPILVATAANDQDLPQVAFDGTSYMVVWRDYRASSTGATYGVRVSRTGRVLDSPAFPVPLAASVRQNPGHMLLAFDGTDYMLAWDDSQAGGKRPVYVARLDVKGKLVDPAGILVDADRGNGNATLELACGVGQCMAVYTRRIVTPQSDRTWGVRVTAAGTVLDPAGTLFITEDTFPFVASDGASYLLGWTTYPSENGFPTAHAAVERVDFAGKADASPVIVSPGRRLLAGITASARGAYVVEMVEQASGASSLYLARVSTGTQTVASDPAGVFVASFQGDYLAQPVVAFDGTSVFTAWPSFAPSDRYELRGASVTPSMVVQDPGGFTIASPPGDAVYVALAGDGAGSVLVVDSEFEADPGYGSRRIRGRIVGVAASDFDAGVDASADPADAADAAHASDANDSNDASDGSTGGGSDASDGAPPVDGGTVADASVPGAGDASTAVDASRPDASAIDAGTPGDGGDDSGCSVGRGARRPGGPVPVIALLALPLFLRRVRRRRASMHVA